MNSITFKYFKSSFQFKASIIFSLAFCFTLFTAQKPKDESPKPNPKPVDLIVLDPAHPHGVQMHLAMQNAFNPKVHVYAPVQNDMEENYLGQIKRHNAKADNLKKWDLNVYTGNDYLDKMLNDKAGSVVILAGNNQKKPEYIRRSAAAGLNIIADKPMALTSADFKKLETSFELAKRNKVFISDLQSMSMRNQMTSILQKELVAIPEVFGKLETGSEQNPAVIQESVHHYYKNITRPAWFFDVEQQGNGLTDIGTHLVDLIQWICFPGTSINYKKDIEMLTAKSWATTITPSQFKRVTKMDTYPEFLKKNLKDSILNVDVNGEMLYKLKGIHSKVAVRWEFIAPKGGGDAHFSKIRGSKASLTIRQDKDTNFQSLLFIEPNSNVNQESYEKTLTAHFEKLKEKYPSIELEKVEKGWKVSSKIKSLKKADHIAVLPTWEVDNMLAKYYTTTGALEKSK